MKLYQLTFHIVILNFIGLSYTLNGSTHEYFSSIINYWAFGKYWFIELCRSSVSIHYIIQHHNTTLIKISPTYQKILFLSLSLSTGELAAKLMVTERSFLNSVFLTGRVKLFTENKYCQLSNLKSQVPLICFGKNVCQLSKCE